MSVLVAATDGRSTWLACDGRMTDGDQIMAENVCKWVFLRPYLGGECAIGISGSYRALDLIRLRSKEVDIGPPDATLRERAEAIRASVWAMLKADGWVDRAEDGKPRWYDINALIAFTGQVFMVTGTGAIHDCGKGSAVGSGESYALGAYDALVDRVGHAEAVRQAVLIACRHSTGCGGLLSEFEFKPALAALRGSATA